MKDVKWGEYKIGNLFDIVGTKSLDSNAIDFIEEGINFIGRTFENNGIQGKIARRNFEPNEPFTITATVIGNYKYVKYQKEPYYCSQNINKLIPKPIIKKWNEKIAYFLITNIQRFVSLYNNQQGGYKLQDIKNHIIQVPIKNNVIDFEFMESFVAELEAQYLVDLKTYLSVAGLKDYQLTAKEQEILNDFENNTMEFGEFKIGELFDINSYKKRFDANKVVISRIGNPYIVRTSLNNGVRGYINEDEKFLNEGNTISFGQDTATVFYQEKAYFTGDKIKILKAKNEKFNKVIAHFFISSMTKSFSSFSWGASSFNVKIIANQKIKLPIQNHQPDFVKIAIFISAIQKLVIKDAVLYIDRKITTTKLL